MTPTGAGHDPSLANDPVRASHHELQASVPPEWHGSADDFIACLRHVVADVLWQTAARCDALQRPAGDGEDATEFNAGIVAATRLVADLALVIAPR